MLESLLGLARFEDGRVRYRPRSVAVGAVVDEALALFRGDAEGKTIELVHQPSGAVVAWTDPQVLQPVVQNLVSNAIKFSRPDSRVEVTARAVGDRVEIEVADEGVGMTPETLTNLLAGAAQPPTEGTAGERGTGLGMMLIHQFVDQLGGRLSAESEVGRGTRFVLSLPRIADAKDATS